MAQFPTIEVLGVYLPAADRDSFETYISKKCEDFAHFPPLRLAEIEAEYRDGLGESALIEVLVTSPDGRFNVGDFCQADPSLTHSHSQVAWCESFLAADGESRLQCDSFEVPSQPLFRVAFYIHYWQSSLGLESSYGPLALPSPQVVPSRLWVLAPYETVC
jgi:hypothetical protein